MLHSVLCMLLFTRLQRATTEENTITTIIFVPTYLYPNHWGSKKTWRGDATMAHLNRFVTMMPHRVVLAPCLIATTSLGPGHPGHLSWASPALGNRCRPNLVLLRLEWQKELVVNSPHCKSPLFLNPPEFKMPIHIQFPMADSDRDGSQAGRQLITMYEYIFVLAQPYITAQRVGSLQVVPEVPCVISVLPHFAHNHTSVPLLIVRTPR